MVRLVASKSIGDGARPSRLRTLLLRWAGIFKVRLALGRELLVGYRDVLDIIAFCYALKVNDVPAALLGLAGGMADVRPNSQ